MPSHPRQAPRARQRAGESTLVIVTHDRRFIRPGDLGLEIEDGRLQRLGADGQPLPVPAAGVSAEYHARPSPHSPVSVQEVG
jgi:hypothetical protein